MTSSELFNRIMSGSTIGYDDICKNIDCVYPDQKNIFELLVRFQNRTSIDSFLSGLEQSVDVDVMYKVLSSDVVYDLLMGDNREMYDRYVELILNNIIEIYALAAADFHKTGIAKKINTTLVNIYEICMLSGFLQNANNLANRLIDSGVMHNNLVFNMIKVATSHRLEESQIKKLIGWYVKNKNETNNYNSSDRLYQDPEILSELINNGYGNLANEYISNNQLAINFNKDLDGRKNWKSTVMENHPLLVAISGQEYDTVDNLLSSNCDFTLFNNQVTNLVWSSIAADNFNLPEQLIVKIIELGINLGHVNFNDNLFSSEDTVLTVLASGFSDPKKDRIFKLIFDKYFKNVLVNSNFDYNKKELNGYTSDYELINKIIQKIIKNKRYDLFEYVAGQATDYQVYDKLFSYIVFNAIAKYDAVDFLPKLQKMGINMNRPLWEDTWGKSKKKYSHYFFDIALQANAINVIKELLPKLSSKMLKEKKPFYTNEEYAGSVLPRAMRCSYENPEIINLLIDEFKKRQIYNNDTIEVITIKNNNVKNHPCVISFMVAAWDNKITDAITRSNIDLNMLDNQGGNVLFYLKDVAYSGHNTKNKLEQIFASAEVGNIDINTTNAQQQTPLHILGWSELPIINKLIELGCDYSKKDINGKSLFSNLFNNFSSLPSKDYPRFINDVGDLLSKLKSCLSSNEIEKSINDIQGLINKNTPQSEMLSGICNELERVLLSLNTKKTNNPTKSHKI